MDSVKPVSFLNPKKILVAAVIGTATASALVPFSCSANQPGEISVKYDIFSGTHDKTNGEGITFVIPFLLQNIKYDGTSQVVKETITTQSKDNIPIDVDVVVEWELKKEALAQIHKNIVGSGTHIDTSTNTADELSNYIHNDRNLVFYTKEIRSRLKNILGDAVTLFTAEEANEHRDDLTEALRNGLQVPGTNRRIPSLTEKIPTEYVSIKDVLVRNVHLPKNLEVAITKKAEALIEQQTAANRVKVETNNALAEQQKGIGQANKLREEAAGKADAIAKISEALKGHPEIIEYLKAEAQKLAGEKGGLIITNGNTPPTILVEKK